MRLLVTGAAGFIGSNFVHYWLEQHPDDHVVAYDLLTYAGNRREPRDVEDRIVFVQGDIGDGELAEKTLREERIDTVVNFAAESHNSLAVVDPTRFFRTNVLGTQTLLEAARAAGASSASTTSRPARCTAISRSTPTRSSPRTPRTGRARPYNASKAGADHAVRAYFETFGLPITITNCSNNYGPFQFPEKVLPLFTTNALDDEPLPMYASTQNKREWLHVLDHCSAIDLVLREGVEGETYNVGSGIEATIEEIADLVLELTEKPQSLKTIVPDRPGHDRRYLLDATKIRDELGWEPDARLARRPGRDGRLVRGEPRLVGAAEEARSGRGDRLALVGARLPRRHRPPACGGNGQRWPLKPVTERADTNDLRYVASLVHRCAPPDRLLGSRRARRGCGLGVGTLPQSEAMSGEAVFVVSGRGWGHGVGMSQYGAYGMANAGHTHEEILAHYYSGTELGQAPTKQVRVLLAEARPAVTISSRSRSPPSTRAARRSSSRPGRSCSDSKLKLPRRTGP